MKRIILFTFIFFTIKAVSAQITPEFFQKKVAESNLVVIGKIYEKESFWNVNKTLIFTSHKVQVTGRIKGQTPEFIEIITGGGDLGDKFQVWSHEPSLNFKASGYFFLNEDNSQLAKPNSYYTLNGEGSFISLPSNKTKKIYEPNLLLTDKIVEFGFDNIQISGTNALSLDILIKTNNEGVGLEFGYGDIFTRYPENVFGSYIEVNQNLEVERGIVLNSPTITLSAEDFSEDIFKTLINGGCNSSSSILTTGIPLTTEFQKLLSVNINIQDLTAIGSISLEEFQMNGNIYYYNPSTEECLPFDNIIYPNPVETGLICSITSFSSDLDSGFPHRTAAGTDNILTIIGANFGSTPGTVEFQNADNVIPPISLASTQAVDFSAGDWTTGQIRVKVPSSPVSAGSGIFQVRTASGMVCPSLTPLDVCYSAITFRSSSTNKVIKIYLSDYPDDGDGQFVFRLDNGLNNNMNALSTIKKAICDWNGKTQIDWELGSVYSSPGASIDNVNSIFLAPTSLFSSNQAANMRTMIGGGRIGACQDFSNPSTLIPHAYATDIDIAVRADLTMMNPPVLGGWNFNSTINPSSTQLDFYSIILHELGHAHMLGHALPNTRVMFPSLSAGSVMKTISAKDDLGGNYVLDISHNILDDPNTNCPSSIGRSSVCAAVGVYNLYESYNFKIYPNPFSAYLNLDFTLEKSGKCEVGVYDFLGKRVIIKKYGALNVGNQKLKLKLGDLPSGIYYISIKVNDEIGLFKTIKI